MIDSVVDLHLRQSVCGGGWDQGDGGTTRSLEQLSEAVLASGNTYNSSPERSVCVGNVSESAANANQRQKSTATLADGGVVYRLGEPRDHLAQDIIIQVEYVRPIA